MRKGFPKLSVMSEPLKESEIESRLVNLQGWRYEEDHLKKSFAFSTFRDSITFLVRLSYEAEQRDHHPEIFNCYNRVEIAINTHDAGGKVTEKDFSLAAAIDTVA
jgi:4a-hydroxytetrahydrobiopterin dehydratase